MAIASALVPYREDIDDLRFRDLEVQLTFIDGQERPVPGVKLTVLTQAGGVCHFYPVDEVFPGQSPVSDAEGRMVFHHTAADYEFRLHYYSNLLGMRFGESSAPQYECVFNLNGREVFRTAFNFQSSTWNQFRQPSITRTWQPPYLDKLARRDDEDLNAWKFRHFDADANGKLDREEVTAMQSIIRVSSPKEEVTERSFLVVKRKIVVPAG